MRVMCDEYWRLTQMALIRYTAIVNIGSAGVNLRSPSSASIWGECVNEIILSPGLCPKEEVLRSLHT